MSLRKRWGYKKEKLEGVGGRDENDVIYSGLNLIKKCENINIFKWKKENKIRSGLWTSGMSIINWLIIFNCFSLKQNLILESNLSSNTTILPLSSAGIIHIWHIVLVIQLQCVFFFPFDRLMTIITNTICGFDFAYCYPVCVVVCVQGCACHDTHVEIRGQCCELSSLLSSLCVCVLKLEFTGPSMFGKHLYSLIHIFIVLDSGLF